MLISVVADGRAVHPIKWQKIGPKEKQLYAIALAGGGFMALAGLWENWKSPDQEWVRSFTIITCPPNELCGKIHNRMPVILPPIHGRCGLERRLRSRIS